MQKFGKDIDPSKKKMTEEEKEIQKQEVEQKKDKFRAFLKSMGMAKE